MTDAVKGLLYQDGNNELLWFVAALYVYSLAFYWIERWSGSAGRLLLVSAILFLLNTVYLHYLHGPSIPWHIHTIGYGCFYMGLGKWYRHVEPCIDARVKKWWIALAALLYVVYIYVFDFHVSYAGSRHVVDALFITLTGLSVMVYGCRWLFNKNRFLLFVGANTLFYFAFHGKVYSLLQTIVAKLLSTAHYTLSPTESFLIGIVIVFLDALILVLPAMFINRFLPWTLGRGFRLWAAE